MVKFEVPENDQSVYEITTKSGRQYLIRCPGEHSHEDEETPRSGVLAYLIANDSEQTVMLTKLDLITSFTRRPDLPFDKSHQPRRMGDLMWRRPGEGVPGFLLYELA